MEYSRKSKERLSTVEPILQEIFIEALGLGIVDITIIEGERDQGDQDKAFYQGNSGVLWPNSKHNVTKEFPRSRAVDAAPYIDGKVSYDYNHCCVLAGIILAMAADKGVKVRWGGAWKGDIGMIGKQKLNDLLHFELVG